jgi:ribosome-binding factor A
MKHRLERVNEVIRRELGDLITRDIRFESKLATVQQVDITPDLKHAHVYISFIGDADSQRKDMALLHSRRADLQSTLSKRIILKYTPQLHFKLDEAAERGSRVLEIMGQLPPVSHDPEPDLVSEDPDELEEEVTSDDSDEGDDLDGPTRGEPNKPHRR